MAKTNQAMGSHKMTRKCGVKKQKGTTIHRGNHIPFQNPFQKMRCLLNKQKRARQIKTNEGTIMPELPQELITEILLWLPVKSILRFRCVAKSICAIIDSQDFINMQLNRSSENKIHRKLISQELAIYHSEKKFRGFRVCDIDDDDGLKTKILFKTPRREIILPYGYCNGLFLLYAKLFNLAVWNPSTKQCRNLPHIPIEGSHYYYHSDICGIGLGYDSTSDDYKVVLINHFYYGIGCQAWIFGLKTSLWRRVGNFPNIQHSRSKFAYFAHGDLHWLCWKREQSQSIVAFDVAKETFSIVTQPVYPIKGYLTGLHVLDECLCISFSSYTFPEEAVLYVRRKDGAEFTWSTLYSVTATQLPPFLKIHKFRNVRVLGYLKEGDKILLDFGFKFVVSNDLKENFFAETDIIGKTKVRYGNPIMLSESLMSVGTTEP